MNFLLSKSTVFHQLKCLAEKCEKWVPAFEVVEKEQEFVDGMDNLGPACRIRRFVQHAQTKFVSATRHKQCFKKPLSRE
jgi:hypothetical protein